MTADQIQTIVDALIETGWRLWSTSHNNTPMAQIVYRWMRDIAPGHLVLEVSSTSKEVKTLDRIGDLLTITSAHEYTIRTLDGREQHWENASFVRIPRSWADNREIFLLGDLPRDRK